ncbi:MAG: phosphate ABC transporter permease PstA [Gammaproteobacteria bacterium]|jgi:phosphate transport system permease protein
MNNQVTASLALTPAEALHKVQAGLARRYRAERRFRRIGLAAIVFGLLFLSFLFISIVSKGYSAFQQTWIELEVDFAADILDPGGTRDPADLSAANYGALVKDSLRRTFPEVSGRRVKRQLYSLVSSGAAFQLRKQVMAEPELIGTTQQVWVPANDDVDMLMKGHFDRGLPESTRRLTDAQLEWVDRLVEQDRLEKRFNTTFFTAGDSREPELSGIRGAVVGSFYTLLVTLLLAFPIGVATAVYLEEYAKRNRWTDLIEVNINNLAAVPSIVFGLLGLAVFINFFGIPRSTPLVGGIVLALMTLPTIIIATRASLKSVPPSIREAALGVGASRTQTVFQHVLPQAMPGMLTGAIIGMAQALGETAPLLMIGMVAFIVDVPGGVTDPSTVLPVQIFLWADSPERAFVERTSAAIMVLLGFLFLMNAIAVVLRKRFEHRW